MPAPSLASVSVDVRTRAPDSGAVGVTLPRRGFHCQRFGMIWTKLRRIPALLGRALSGRDPVKDSALAVYTVAVGQARQPRWYVDYAVPDSLDGRFDMIALHVFLIMQRLRSEGAAAKPLSQALADLLCDDMDQSLRELGVGDMGVGTRVRRMAEAFYGRMAAYDAGLRDGDLESALARNIYRGAAPEAARLTALADYVRSCVTLLAGQSLADLAAGRVSFGEEQA